MSATKGERILRYQDLYKRYSRLGLTAASDRLYAINGLQSRLLKAFDTEGGFGIFDEGPDPKRGHLRRSLLWHRGDDVARMDRITFPARTSVAVPSWSWMAYTGGINYLDLDFTQVHRWMDLRSPWTRHSWRHAPTSEPMPPLPGGALALGGVAQDFDLASIVEAAKEEDNLIFDRPEEVHTAGLKCVVLGAKEGHVPRGARRCFVLVIAPADQLGKTWFRVGVGYLPERYVRSEKTDVVIC